ncbi:MAG: hypothetical protein JSS11_17090 [Verrucomicrobia bacterium]|nr:hypothetical protein [Verrucomicrobiota bacterium]
MSYDLYLDRSAPVTSGEFGAYFSQRPNFRNENGQAVYENKDTGVYFIFTLATEGDDEPTHKVSFNLNFFRPHFFAREAASELAAVIAAFGFAVHDPQNDGMGDVPFSEEGFQRGWDHGNAFGYRAMLRSKTPPPVIHSRPTAELDAVWRWNWRKAATQDELGDEIFVPRIFWVVGDGKLSSAAVWPDGIPELVPSVDLYFIGRDKLAPRRLFRREQDTCIVPRSALEQALGPMTADRHPLPSRLFKGTNELKDVRRFVTGLRRNAVNTTVVSMDQVLNQELVDQARSP